MKVAISTDGDLVSAHFGRCPSFTIVELEGDKLIRKQVVDNPGHHPGFLPQFLKEKGVNAIVAGGMGQRAQMLFDESGIKTIMGISGKVDEIVKQATAGTLKGGESLCQPGAGKGYGVEKTACDHPDEDNCEHE
ncbi:MAG: NifB/NifX family molybdenum-iron cluster-binding protein [Candidatus Omnitrophica bacterium]|nr:NifB/NifX family molybdenum-iron cluster-binding protein [Candidatus Omnitrophota bacterium]